MKKIAYVAVTCVLLSACGQGQQDYQQQGYNQGQQQAYYPNQQGQNGYVQQDTMQQPQQQAQQQIAPAPEPVQQQAPAPSRPSHAHANWKGKWIGVEGMYLDITPTSPGNYDIEMLGDLDNIVRVNGVDSGGVIAFQRNGQRFTLRPSNGDQIGLKWLDGQKNCLMVQEGEGYCR